MTVTYFLILLSAFSVLTGLVTEAFKKIVSDKKTNLVACIIALIIGLVGTIVFYQLNSIDFCTNNIIYAILMGFASALCAMCGYDKVVQLVRQFMNDSTSTKE